MNKIKEITSFKQIKKIIAPIPEEKFCISNYFEGDSENPDKCCFLGHIQLALAGTANINFDGFGARQLTAKMISEVHGIDGEDGAEVNNSPRVNGYTEPVIKDRLMHMIKDGIKWEKSKQVKQ